MGMYSEIYGGAKHALVEKKLLEERIKELQAELDRDNLKYKDLLNAQRLLATVSDKNTEATLSFITSVVNKTLQEIFKSDTRKITLKKKLFAGNRAHINVELVNGDGNVIDLNLQSGTGLKQIVSGLFTICLVEIRKGRRFIIFDERFSGLHKEAKKVLSEILKIFAEGGFQFMFVEYSLNNIGKIYNVEKPGNVAKVYALDEDKDYNDEDVFIFSDQPDLTLLDHNYKDDEDGEVLIDEVSIV